MSVPSYDAEMRQLRQSLLRMGGLVEEMLGCAIEALANHDAELARRTRAMDDEVDQLEKDIDDQCLQLLAVEQRTDADLRFVAMSMKLVTDLERMGDLIANICDRVTELVQYPRLARYVDLPNMAQLVRTMINDVLDAYVAADVEQARAVVAADAAVDEIFFKIYCELEERLQREPNSVAAGMKLAFVAKYLERLGDHATNIAEEVVFMVEGQDVRHTGLRRTGVSES